MTRSEKKIAICTQQPFTAIGLVSRVSPAGSAIRSLIPSHRELLRSKAVVVSVAEKSGHDPVRHG
jgi:hypothetical protein